jgi:hypothetical protein
LYTAYIPQPCLARLPESRGQLKTRDMSVDVEGGMSVAIHVSEGRGDRTSTRTGTMGDYDYRSLNREVYEGFCQAPSMWWDACQTGYDQM